MNILLQSTSCDKRVQ